MNLPVIMLWQLTETLLRLSKKWTVFEYYYSTYSLFCQPNWSAKVDVHFMPSHLQFCVIVQIFPQRWCLSFRDKYITMMMHVMTVTNIWDSIGNWRSHDHVYFFLSPINLSPVYDCHDHLESQCAQVLGMTSCAWYTALLLHPRQDGDVNWNGIEPGTSSVLSFRC